jgi:asparagine synthase (glutamine-hydrolysing)
MCGIWFCLGDFCSANYNNYVNKIKARGPEDTMIQTIPKMGTMGFNRLAINGLNKEGMQPFSSNGIIWMCNGEIYNWKTFATLHNITTKSNSDCEVLGELYLKFRDNLPTFFRLLDGVFSIVICDTERNKVIIARDPYGIRPLFMGYNYTHISNDHLSKKYFSSEIKGLVPLCKNVEVFKPGTYRIFNPSTNLCEVDERYHQIPFLKNPHYENFFIGATALRIALEASVEKRLLTERPVACLLSGGLDSSLIASLVQKNLKKLGLPSLKTFCIGMPGSTDVAYARKVADFIQSDHTEIIKTPQEFLEAIPHVIKDIESYDTTTVRASVGNWLVSKYIKENTECKVVFNGDGSDEIFGSYMYFYNAPNDSEFEAEVQRLLKDIHYFDVLRSDRSISSHGLEPRTPFLDRQFVQVALSMLTSHRRPVKGSIVEKNMLRRAFDDGLTLPDEVLWRQKEAFSDGVSGLEKSWYQIIQENINVPDNWLEIAKDKYEYLTPTTKEMFYYRSEFEKYYKGQERVIPYFWMPKWSPGATDPSARTLNTYF